MTPIETRRSPRIRPGRIVRVTVLEPARIESGTLVDISETGVGLLTETPFEVNSTLHVEFENHLLVGTAVYCRILESGYFRIGVELVHKLGGADWEALIRKWQGIAPASEPAPTELSTQ